MSHELICTWLGLPAEVWPPDHYRLLGLSPGENDPHLIEERVHQRLDAVRRYQMMHPEQATEAMNRIAQAFVCLSEPTSKRVYDAGLLGVAPIVAETLPVERKPEEAVSPPSAAVVEDRDPLVLVYNPAEQELAPPIRRAEPAALLPPETETLTVVEALEVPVAELAQPPIEAPEASPVRRDLSAKRMLYQRIAQTRRLLSMWNEIGKFLASPKRRLTRLGEVNALMRVLSDLRVQLRRFPVPLDEVGQPGYLIVALTQLGSASLFQGLLPSQREALTLDWENGQRLLLSHRDFLRQEARTLRQRSLGQRLAPRLRHTVMEHPGRILVLIAVLALNVALVRTYVYGWVQQALKPEPAKMDSSKNVRSGKR